MSKLFAFLNPEPIKKEKDVFISDRFRDEEGNLVPFRIRTITQEENDRLIRKSMKTRKENGQTVEYLDNVELTKQIVVAAVVFPDFRDKELCDAYGTMDPFELPGKMLRSGEYNALTKAIFTFSEVDESSFVKAKN